MNDEPVYRTAPATPGLLKIQKNIHHKKISLKIFVTKKTIFLPKMFSQNLLVFTKRNLSSKYFIPKKSFNNYIFVHK